MLNVTESVNGKFNIVLSDGYRSQLHDRGKIKTKSDLVTNEPAGKKSRVKQQVSQEKLKQNKERSNYSKGAKPSRVAAKFNGKLSANNKGPTESNNKFKNTTQKSANNGAANETAAFVTKNELTKLLETLNETDNTVDDTQQGSSDKVSQPTEKEEDERTEEIKINENLEISERFSNEKESSSLVVKENNGENVSSDKTEIIKPIAMRSSFAIGAPGLVINNLHDDKAAKHRQWVKELEQQIQEKKMREKQMKENQSVDIAHRPIQTERAGIFSNKQNKESFRTTATVTAEFQQETDRSSTGHARGRGLMSILSESEADKQRKKIIEHQKAIELQVEDRRRRKMEERERRLREEAIEEERVAKEREKLQKQFQEEMIKMEEKEERAKHRAQVLQEGISKAFESAQQLKRDRRKNRLQGSNAEVSVKDENDNFDNTGGQEIISPRDSVKHQAENNKNVVPPLNLRTSISPVNKSSEKLSSRISEATVNMKRNSLISARDVKTSYSETDKDKSETLINKWVNEDFGALNTNQEQNYNGSSIEVVIPFHRTSSATLFRESLASQDVHDNDHEPANKVTGNDRKVIKNGRSVPEVQSTRTSLLREKGTDSKNTSLKSRRKKHEVDRGQHSLQKSKPHTTSQAAHDDQATNKYKNTSSTSKETQATNIPSHLLATFTPTAHQEKILEQLATLRKGLLLKDEEIKTRVFHINEYEVHV